MIMADVLTWFLIIAGSYLVLACYWLASVALFPSVVEGCCQRYGRRPIASTLLGLALLVPFLLIGGALAKGTSGAPPVSAVVKVLMALPALLALLGSSGLALRIGTGLPSPLDAAQPWRRVLRGGIVLAPTFLLPFVGWFIVFPWALVSGFGAAIMTILSRRSAPILTAPAPAEASTVGA